ncbi:putative eukaryotic initiation factor 4a [Trypanosoma rangeli]|uniref:Putative eukaryotic initiation factor 4a n=1 Tax=Trypanosoma rangeli TaxID=5698 RepID=A0A422NS99_TRYRA|nr:putative eukaryotic initiation factor 4a [Trypanosoma rangeli]RNF08321.1 putative eukaryotic initiation factor 4a [Trypanosoma rangeli]|eukprot:RNF08321.1 putative eukaryotic initiation factor 4a [Trypanosoma rangeli]
MFIVAPGPLSLARAETCKPSVFRPPARFAKAAPPSNGCVALLPRPLYSAGSTTSEKAPKEARLVPPQALGQSQCLEPDVDCATLPPMSSSSGFPLLSAEVNVFSHKFTEEATNRRVYPTEMFLSARRDAAHTPYGVLRWVVRQYLRIPSLKVPPHLQLSLHGTTEQDDGLTRGTLGCSLKGSTKCRKPVRLTHHKVMSILSRITPAKYNVLLEELLLLPLRQVDDAELMEICKVIFEKAVQEPAYCGVYAQLAQDICSMKNGEHDLGSRDQCFLRRFRRMLIALCEAQFQRPLQLSADELVDCTTGAPLSEEEVEGKRSRLKRRLVGNIRFVAELFKMGFLTARVIDDIIRILVKDYNLDDPTAKEEAVFEVFQTLLRHTGVVLKEQMPNLLAQALGIAKTIELSHPKLRVVFLMMDLSDLNRVNGWVASELVQQHVQEPKAGKTTSAAATLGEKGSGVVSPMSPVSIALPQELNATKKPPDDSVRATSPHHLIGDDQTSGGYNELNMNTLNAYSKDVSKENGDDNGSNSISSNGNTSNNKNTGDMLRPQSLAKERVSRAQHQPYGQLVLTNIVNDNNENRFNSSMDSLQLSSPLTPVYFVPDGVAQFQMDMRPHHISMSLAHTTSDWAGSPCGSFSNTTLTDTTVNIKEVTEQLMGLFRNGEEATAVSMLRGMDLKNVVVCLTWWLRLAATRTSLFEDRKRVASLLSSLLSNCGGVYDAKTIFSTILEWIRFDVEKGEYDNCPRMFENMAQMILYCHLPCNDALPHVDKVRNMMQCGLFNVFLRELTISEGTDQMVTVVKSCYPVSLQILNNLHDPNDERQILRIAAQNRFRLLPYLLSVSSGTSNVMPGTPSMRPRGSSSPSSSLRSSPLGESFSSTGHYDPLVQCLVFARVSDDPEFVLFRKIRDAAAEGGGFSPTKSPRWRDEAVQLALTPLGNNSTVCELIAVMRVVGAVLACSCVSGNNDRILASSADVDYVVDEILSKRPGILYQGAVTVELIMHHTQALNDTVGTSKVDTMRLRSLKRMFENWCAHDIIRRAAVLELLDALECAGDRFSVYTAYHDNVADMAWQLTLRELRGY